MRNVKALNPKTELEFMINHYKFDLSEDGKYIVVATNKNGTRRTIHIFGDEFFINSSVRKIKITKNAEVLWAKHFKEYSLIEVQGAINYCIQTYQDITTDNLLKVIKLCRKQMKGEK